MTPDVAAIAAGLTKAQREALAGPVRYPGYGLTLLCRGQRNTLEAMERRRLVDGAALTPLGLAIRAHLLQDKEHEGS